jgi:hypothetical protein
MPSIFNSYIIPFRRRMSYKDGVAYQDWASQERHARELLRKAVIERKRKAKQSEVKE